MENILISGFYKKSVRERLDILREAGILSAEDYNTLLKKDALLNKNQADKMVENVISVFGLPMGLGLNFLVNGKDYLVPMVVEEPSIIAAVSAMAKIVRQAGGFTSSGSGSLLTGQLQLLNVRDSEKAKSKILDKEKEIIKMANSLHPNMLKRGGGAQSVEVRILKAEQEMIIVHLIVDVKDAMGANLVNSMCEYLAPYIEKLTAGKIFLRILSNLADKSLVKTHCTIPIKYLEKKGYSGEQVRDGIILANDFALADPYRAATHNKGIMNGIDALIIATGNDWRAAEAGAHAFAVKGGRYTALTKWFKNEQGDLVGELELPVRVGTVGGSLLSNPAVALNYRILGINNAKELSELIGAVGLAQNLGAIRALATEGIQAGHMKLHARSVVQAAGIHEDYFEEVLDKLIESREIKVWKAREIVTHIIDNSSKASRRQETLASGNGKIILLGEHAVVYGSNAIAAPISLAMQAFVHKGGDDGIRLKIDAWNVNKILHAQMDKGHALYKSLLLILEKLALENEKMTIEVFPNIPKAAGLGASAALAVAIIRALSNGYQLNLNNEEIADISFQSENIMHGSASGIDNTLATYGKFIRFKKGAPPIMEELKAGAPIPVVIGLTGQQGLTSEMVSRINRSWQNDNKLYEGIFNEINSLVLLAEQAVKAADFDRLGELMNLNQGYLNALQVSTKELEELIDIARQNGALGAKLTGGGGGGAMIALCPGNQQTVADAFQQAGYQAITTEIK